MTEEKTITEQNKLIAQFMGLSFDPKKKDGAPFYKETNKDGWESKSYCNPLYHSSWASLMPVVEKISKMEKSRFGFTIDPHEIEVRDYAHENQRLLVSVVNDDSYPMIEMYYMAVCDFIKWYNAYIEKQPTTQNQGV